MPDICHSIFISVGNWILVIHYSIFCHSFIHSFINYHLSIINQFRFPQRHKEHNLSRRVGKGLDTGLKDTRLKDSRRKTKPRMPNVEPRLQTTSFIQVFSDLRSPVSGFLSPVSFLRSPSPSARHASNPELRTENSELHFFPGGPCLLSGIFMG